MKCSVHFLRGPWKKERVRDCKTASIYELKRYCTPADRPPVVPPVLNLDFCELELWPDADQNHHSVLFHVALHWLTRYCSNTYALSYIYILNTIYVHIFVYKLEANLELSSIVGQLKKVNFRMTFRFLKFSKKKQLKIW